MAPRQREAAPSAGLLASAFSFVTREIESFVTAATGGEVQPKRQQDDQPEASSSRVTLDGKRRERDETRGSRDGERERERRAKRVRKRSELESERARARRRVRREPEEDGSDDERDRALRAMKKRVMSPPPTALAPRSRSSEREAADDEDDEPPARPPPAKSVKKRRDVVVEDPDPLPAQDVAKEDALPPLSKKKSVKNKDRSAGAFPTATPRILRCQHRYRSLRTHASPTSPDHIPSCSSRAPGNPRPHDARVLVPSLCISHA
ncbi:hypothetical protein C8Q73DRAFT_10328 [Cubamyces lactineus]|nr:hypothetical protein C8Q73DRAFT_10328 [Cubamyces lactineus]